MAKLSGYQVRISAFIEASPKDMEAMKTAITKIDAVCEVMRGDGFLAVTHDTRFMLSRKIEDAPSPAQAELPETLLTAAVALDRRNRA